MPGWFCQGPNRLRSSLALGQPEALGKVRCCGIKNERCMKLTDFQTEPVPSTATEQGLVAAIDLLKSKLRLIAAVTAIAGAMAALVLLFIPSYYTAASTIVIPNQSRSFGSSLVAQLGPIAALTGDLGNKDSSDRYISLLKSNSISDALINKFDLRRVYKKSKVQKLRDKLADNTRFQVLKGGLVTITVTDSDPQRAADIANGYIEELYTLNSRLAVDEASQRRSFYQQQVESAKQQLTADEQRLKEAEEKTGLIQPDAQAKGVIDTIGRLRTEIALKEIELRGMSTGVTPSNPDYIRLQAQLAGLRSELKKVEDSDASGIVGTRNLPSAGLEYARRLRDVKIDEAIVTALLKEFEEARIDEARSAPLVQMVDRAQPADQRAGPPRTAIILAAMLSGLVCAIVYVLWRRRNMRFSHILARVDAL